jgi:hypothetical protein
MSALVGNLRNKLIAALLLGLVVPQAYCHAYQFRGGGGGGGRSVLQRAIGSRSGGGNQQRPLVNRPANNNNGPAKRVLAGKNGNSSQQDGYSKSSILQKYGEGTGGNWTSMGRTPATTTPAPVKPASPQQATTQQAQSPQTPPQQVTTTRPFTPPGPSQPITAAPAKAPAPRPAVAGGPGPAVAGATVAGATAVGAAVAAPAVAGPKPTPAPVAAVAQTGDVDLVLEDVKYIEPATETAGPTYRMKLRNVGARAAGKFRIGAFAERGGQLSDDAPKVVTEVASLPAGEVSEVTMRLPISAVRLVANSSSESATFDQLLVVVDLDNAIVESDKSNNVASLERSELETAVE